MLGDSVPDAYGRCGHDRTFSVKRTHTEPSRLDLPRGALASATASTSLAKDLPAVHLILG